LATRRALTCLSAVPRVTRQATRCLSLSCTPAEVLPHALRGSTGPHLAALPYHRSYVSLARLIRGRRFLPGARCCGSLAAVAELRPKPTLLSSELTAPSLLSHASPSASQRATGVAPLAGAIAPAVVAAWCRGPHPPAAPLPQPSHKSNRSRPYAPPLLSPGRTPANPHRI
jgi:hypothetical protein